ncbi:50S ribosomal protein L25/general stress protein Ctc [Ferrimonas lipolytica]|uniref:Large ribosomal subunit protein bL25 n=1 Tax=Ferrimonas lipolytica TaxID=2724191 RepID=A0A6H1UDD9_9GAMM|nr:50S ribosomal protein L25/general stress protein Ctc [Ferrimonas lipolytica]QIZ77091.1 50S ribosomal protein L25/general stress protein Ctc [Ferrimonas lipolytica]
MPELTFDAEVRTEHGTGASRRLRHQDKLPAILYGGGKDPVSLTLEHNKVNLAQEKEAFYSQVLTLKINGKTEDVIVKAMQRHPYKPKLVHVDFLRVSKNNALTTTVPLHFLNEDTCVGAKAGGTVVHLLNEVEVKCLPADLPEFIEVDIQQLDAGQSLHLHDIALPKGVELTELSKGDDHDLSVVSVQAARGGSEEDEASESAEPGTEQE